MSNTTVTTQLNGMQKQALSNLHRAIHNSADSGLLEFIRANCEDQSSLLDFTTAVDKTLNQLHVDTVLNRILESSALGRGNSESYKYLLLQILAEAYTAGKNSHKDKEQ